MRKKVSVAQIVPSDGITGRVTNRATTCMVQVKCVCISETSELRRTAEQLNS